MMTWVEISFEAVLSICVHMTESFFCLRFMQDGHRYYPTSPLRDYTGSEMAGRRRSRSATVRFRDTGKKEERVRDPTLLLGLSLNFILSHSLLKSTIDKNGSVAQPFLIYTLARSAGVLSSLVTKCQRADVYIHCLAKKKSRNFNLNKQNVVLWSGVASVCQVWAQ